MSNLRTISQFKTRLAGGGARPNLFEISVPTFPTGIQWSDEDFRFLCKAAAIPGSTVNPVDVPFRGRSLKVGGDRTFAPWVVTIINDENFKLHTAFMQWMNLINKLDNATGSTSPAAYMRDAFVYQLGRGANIGKESTSNSTALGGSAVTPLRTFKLYDVWPSDVGEIPLSYDSDNTLEEYTVEFQVQYVSIGETTDQTGIPVR